MPPASMWSIGWRQPSKYRLQTSSSDPHRPGQGRRLCASDAPFAVREAPPGGRAGRLSWAQSPFGLRPRVLNRPPCDPANEPDLDFGGFDRRKGSLRHRGNPIQSLLLAA